MYETALVVGKFCPLHKGHELLIKTAQAGAKHVIIVSYTSEDYGYSADLRQAWLEARVGGDEVTIIVLDGDVPKDDAPADEHREFCAVLMEKLGFQPDVVYTSEDYGVGFADYLSRRWASHVAHESVDQARTIVPISGTMLRENPKLWMQYTNPPVVKHRTQRVLFIGGESCGKTTIAKAMSETTGMPWVPEYGRQLFEEQNGKLSYEDYLLIAKRQIEDEEEAMMGSPRYVFCDTSPLVTLFYSLEWEGKADPELVRLASRFYHRIYFCDRGDTGYVDDGTRSGEKFAYKQDAFYLDKLARMGASHKWLIGSVERRVAKLLVELKCSRTTSST